MSLEKIKAQLKEKKNMRLAGTAIASGGFFLFAEHIYLYGLEFSAGHDWLGLAIMLLGGGISRLGTD